LHTTTRRPAAHRLRRHVLQWHARHYLRAFDLTTGRKLWQARLPAGGQATRMTYRANGKQMVVVAAGGHGSFGTTIGDAVVAYVLE